MAVFSLCWSLFILVRSASKLTLFFSVDRSFRDLGEGELELGNLSGVRLTVTAVRPPVLLKPKLLWEGYLQHEWMPFRQAYLLISVLPPKKWGMAYESYFWFFIIFAVNSRTFPPMAVTCIRSHLLPNCRRNPQVKREITGFLLHAPFRIKSSPLLFLLHLNGIQILTHTAGKQTMPCPRKVQAEKKTPGTWLPTPPFSPKAPHVCHQYKAPVPTALPRSLQDGSLGGKEWL